MKINAITVAALCVAALTISQSAHGAARVWGNTGTDYNTSANWNSGAGPAPGTGDVGKFTSAELTQPNLSASLSNSGLYFNGTGVSGYDVTSNAGVTLTLTGQSTSGSSGTSDSSAAAIRFDNTSGTNTIDVPLILASSTGTSTFFGAVGGTLVVNSVISDAGAGKALSLKNGTFDLNNNNTFSGGASIDAASTTVVLGNDGALGTGTFTINNTSTLQAGGGTRTVANDVVFGGNTTLSGSNAFTFNGTATSSGSSSRTLTVSNTGGATFGGTVNLEESGAPAGRSFTINGASNVNLNGVVQDGSAQPASLKYSGTGTLTLANANTFSGGTFLSNGMTVSTHNGAFGTGNVSLTASNVTLTLQGVTDSIADNANLAIGVLANTGDLVNLNFSGTETIGTLTINGVAEAAGQWGAPGSGATFTDPTLAGTGFLNVVSSVPEPGTLVMLALGGGLLASIQRIRSKRS